MTVKIRKAVNPASLEMGKAHSYLERVILKLNTLDETQKQPLVGVLQYISDYIGSTMKEISALKPAGKDGKMLMSSTGELEEVISETEGAASSIMSAAEAIEAVAVRLKSPESDELMAAVTKIYEASAFQDITGQRITKVVHAIQNVETRIEALMHFCNVPSQQETGKPDEPTGKDVLLNGPQRQSTANSQSDIDRLFNMT